MAHGIAQYRRRPRGALRFLFVSALFGLTACGAADGIGESPAAGDGDIETETTQEGLTGISTPVALWKMDDCSGNDDHGCGEWYTGGNSYRLSVQAGRFVFSVAVPG